MVVSRLTFSAYGDDEMVHTVVDKIREEAGSLAIAKQHLSVWTDHGLPDFLFTLHSTGTTYWNTMGTMFGLDAITEMPAPQQGPFAYVGDDVRSDSLWFDRKNHQPLVVVEFERYTRKTDQAKLVGKVDSLLLAHHRWEQKPAVLVLVYWTKGLASLPDHQQLRRRVTHGFTTAAQEDVAPARGCELIFFQSVLSEVEKNRWALTQIVERGQP